MRREPAKGRRPAERETKRASRASLLLMLAHLIAFVAMLQGQGAPAPSFAQTVLQDFDAWDTSRQGKLTQDEIDKAALDPQFHGADAAALAALHRWLLLVPQESLPTLDKAWFQNYVPVPLHIPKDTPSADAKTARQAYAASPGSLQSSFLACLKRLSRVGEQVLFDADGPALADVRQGALGDCYMLAPLGAMVHRNPDDIRQLVVKTGDGYDVHFGDGKTVHVGTLTDTELALGGASARSGIWVRVVENAYGNRKTPDGETRIGTDVLHGGNGGVAGQAFTGHKFKGIKLIGDFQKDVPADTLQKKMTQLRNEIPKAQAEKRLMVASTPKHAMPKSITGSHAYAVFGYDAATDRVTLWNPHGNNFTPKGDEGPENGYKIEDGVFSMPLEMFVRTFGRIQFEGAN
jgi:hypothetical protein